MGYSIEQVGSAFYLPAGQKAAALAAVKSMFSGAAREYLYVAREEVVAARTVEAALMAWGWEAEVDRTGTCPHCGGPLPGLATASGDIIDLIWRWDYAGDEDRLFATIAPFIAPGSWIEMRGAEGEHWRWMFDGRNVTRIFARIIWDGETEHGST